MGRVSWLGVVCVCAMAAALPTEPDTLVVARDETQNKPSTSPEGTTRVPIKITEMFVESDISLRYAHTTILTRVRNSASTAQNATFNVLLPNTAFISGFVMILNGVPYKALVKEKKEAQKIFDDAVSKGQGAAQVATARNSNQFTVSVNVEPHTTAVFNLTCEELLKRTHGVYNHVINLNPGTVVPALSVYVRIQESADITVLRVPELRTGAEISATEKDPQNKNAKIQKCGKEATVIFRPTPEEQIQLMKVYEEKRKQSQENQNDKSTNGNLGQFVVQYDVDRSNNNGEVLVNDGYFVHFLGCEDLPPLYKHIIFVLDTSGSMSGRKIIQLREAMNLILDQLRPLDYFSIVEFNTGVFVHDLKEASSNATVGANSSKTPTLVPPFVASKENIRSAHIITDRLKATGSTNIYDALMTAVDLVNKGIGWTPEGGPADTNNELESIILFLTDGLANVHVSDPKKIASDVTAKNHVNRSATIHCLGFGEGANMFSLREIALLNGGLARHIYEAADAVLQLIDLFKEISSPLLSNVKFVYAPGQIENDSLTKHSFSTYNRGTELVVAGRCVEGKDLDAKVDAYRGVDKDSYDRKIFQVVPLKRRGDYLPLERIWVYLTIQQLLDKIDADLDKPKDQQTKEQKQALALALQYEFVTPLTSLVVVKPNETGAVEPKGDKPGSPGNSGMPGRPGAIGKPSPGNAGMPGRPGAIGKPSKPGRPMPSKKPTRPSPPSKPAPNPLIKYRLTEFPWTRDILREDIDALEVTDNSGATTNLQLSTDVANDPSDGGECPDDVSGGGPGVCTYLVRCDAAKTITAQDYNTKYCDLNGFAGVCCPTTITARR